MPKIQLVTMIDAPIERCFDLARSIELDKLSTAGTHEEATAIHRPYITHTLPMDSA